MANGSRTSQSRQFVNQPSLLLSQDENDLVFRLVGPKSWTLATAVVQIYLSDPPSHNRWSKRFCGVVCFVRDGNRRAYYIRCFDVDQQRLLWEQEIYQQLRYKSPRRFFHTFEAEACQAGLNFADEDEADKFKKEVDRKLQAVHERNRRKQAAANSVVPVPNPTPQGNAPSTTGIIPYTNTPTAQETKMTKAKKERQRGKNAKKGTQITKADIGEPTNFQHVQHIGWDPNTGFDLDNIGPELRLFFQRAGVSESQLQDKETRAFIYEFLGQNKVEDIIASDWKPDQAPGFPSNDESRYVPGPIAPAPPPVPARQPATPTTPTLASRGIAPAPPSRLTPAPEPRLSPFIGNSPRATTGGAMASPPPPPPPNRSPVPFRTSPRSPLQAATSSASGGPLPTPPSSSGGCPPPPPPPPPPPCIPSFPMAGDPGMPPPPQLPVSNGRPALFEDIQKGTSLKPVQQDPNRVVNSSCPRNELLDQIRQGTVLRSVERSPAPELSARDQTLALIRQGAFNLRHVTTGGAAVGDEDRNSGPPKQTVLDGMAGALARALADRARVIYSSDDSDDDDEDDDDEWDD